MKPQNKSPTLKTAGVTFGLLSLFAGAFLFFNGMVIWSRRIDLENTWILEMMTPMITIGIGLFIVALVVIVLLR